MKDENNYLYKYIIIFLFCVFIFQNLYYYPKLPEIIASHYNATGQADGWMRKKIFFITILSIYFFLIALLLILPYIINKLPKSIINLPNKHLWFNELIYEKIKYKFINIFDVFNIALFIFFIFTNQLTIIANLNKTNLNMKCFFLILIIYLLFIILWIIIIFYKFSKKNYLLFIQNNYFNNEKIDKDTLLILLGLSKEKIFSNEIKIKKNEYDFNDFKKMFRTLK